MTSSHAVKQDIAQSSIAICMAVYNGGDFLAKQLQSFSDQTVNNWSLYVSDDGSSDQSIDILNAFKKTSSNVVELFHGPKKGFSHNFLSLVARPEVNADFYAFADHDDIWYPSKLERAVDYLSRVSIDIPALYCSATEYIDTDDAMIGSSTIFQKKLSFNNALIQCVAGGNTMVFNHAARKLLISNYAQDLQVPSYDWFLYQLITGVNGCVYYDKLPSLGYRQHRSNVMGENRSFKARLARALKLLSGEYGEDLRQNVVLLRHVREHLTPENQDVLTAFERMQSSSIIRRLRAYHASGIYRQRVIDNVAIALAVMLNRI